MTGRGESPRKVILRAIATGAIFYLARKCCGGSPLASEKESAILGCYTGQLSEQIDGRGSTLLFWVRLSKCKICE